MAHTKRTTITLIILTLLIPCGSRLAHSQTSAPGQVPEETFTISGTVGLAGVLLKGLPGEPVTDTNGQYTAQVTSGWSGTVKPVKEGYNFEPAARTYTEIMKDRNGDDYVAQVWTFMISGNVESADVLLQGLPGRVVSGENGYYSVKVPYRWTGVIEPVKEAHSFTPSSKPIGPVTQNQLQVNFTARMKMVTITDKIEMHLLEGRPPEPISGVRITAQPGGYSAVTDVRGRYTIQVPYGWSGELSMAKDGFEFVPNNIRYDNVTQDIDSTDSGRAASPSWLPSLRAAAAGPATDVLVIPTTEVAAEAFAQVVEDMRVMLQILREKLSEPRMISGVLYDFGDFFGDSGRSVEALYIQGYGAVFMMKVDFPLSLPTQGQGDSTQADQQAVDPVWQRARDRLYSPPGGMMGFGSRLPQSRQADAKSFEQLKQDLIDSLRHAANIRNVEPNEWVIVTVVGRSGASPTGGFSSGMGGMGGGMMGAGMGGYGGGMAGGYGGVTGGVGGYRGGGYGSSGSFSGSASGGFRMEARSQSGGSTGVRSAAPAQPSAPTTVLTIQAKKADIDALADGRTDLDQFRQKVKVFTY
jgi:hypothetical protein